MLEGSLNNPDKWSCNGHTLNILYAKLRLKSIAWGALNYKSMQTPSLLFTSISSTMITHVDWRISLLIIAWLCSVPPALSGKVSQIDWGRWRSLRALGTFLIYLPFLRNNRLWVGAPLHRLQCRAEAEVRLAPGGAPRAFAAPLSLRVWGWAVPEMGHEAGLGMLNKNFPG